MNLPTFTGAIHGSTHAPLSSQLEVAAMRVRSIRQPSVRIIAIMDSRLLGIWDSDTNERYAKFRLHFLESGDLTCTIFVVGSVSSVVEMTWYVEANSLITRAASSTREDRIEFAVERDGRLMVGSGWTDCHYHRVY